MPLLVFAIVLTQLVAPSRGSGQVEIKLLGFTNTEGKRRDGQCCDPTDWSWFGGDDECDPCDHVFDFCLGNDPESSSMDSCGFARVKSRPIAQNQIQFDRDTRGIENPIKSKFDKWPGVVKLNLEILDDDDGSYDFIDHLDYQYTPREMRRQLDAPVKRIELVGSKTRMNIELRVYCDLGYYGADCGTYCKAQDDRTGHYRCNPITGEKICLFGWAGPDCKTNLNDCNGDRCQSGATCVDHIGYYTCKCPPGKTGVYCDGEINECASIPCQNGGTCIDETNGFTCQCAPTWTGQMCETKYEQCASKKCEHGYCNVVDGKDTCICDAGYTGEFCNTVFNRCDEKPCHIPNTFFCDDIPGHYKCHCKDGFTGKNCDVKRSACDSDPCLNHGICEDRGEDFVCHCPDGFEGERCEYKTNECESNPCQNGGICMDLHLGYRCLCPDFAKGCNCEQYKDVCYSKPCLNGGTCVTEDDGYSCICPPNTDSPNCEVFKIVDHCTPNPCSNNAVCHDGGRGDFTCTCPEGYRGQRCDIEINRCDPNPCRNGGDCMNLFDDFDCNCQPGYAGKTCEEESDECEYYYEPCENGGTCIDMFDAYRCECPDAYTGPYCEDPVDSTTHRQTTAETDMAMIGKESTEPTLKLDMSFTTDIPDEVISMMTTAKSENITTDSDNVTIDVPFSSLSTDITDLDMIKDNVSTSFPETTEPVSSMITDQVTDSDVPMNVTVDSSAMTTEVQPDQTSTQATDDGYLKFSIKYSNTTSKPVSPSLTETSDARPLFTIDTTTQKVTTDLQLTTLGDDEVTSGESEVTGTTVEDEVTSVKPRTTIAKEDTELVLCECAEEEVEAQKTPKPKPGLLLSSLLQMKDVIDKLTY